MMLLLFQRDAVILVSDGWMEVVLTFSFVMTIMMMKIAVVVVVVVSVVFVVVAYLHYFPKYRHHKFDGQTKTRERIVCR
jgi:hypothetical protein